MFDKARNKPRDLYDLWYLTEGRHVNAEELGANFIRKLDFRNKKFNEIKGEFSGKESRLRKLWNDRLKHQINNLPEFEDVYRFVKKTFRNAGLVE